jgi:O-methyltransferase
MMARRSLLPEAVEGYVWSLVRETPVQRDLRAETQSLSFGHMQAVPDVAALLSLLVRLVGARQALEVGTFTGYSALAIAAALPADGKLITCEISANCARVARRSFERAGLADRVEVRVGPAAQTLRALQSEGASFDLAFVDADKESYDVYYEACLALLRPGGLIALDNALWSGAVADSSNSDPAANLLRSLNQKAHDDARVQACLLTVGDGVLLGRKRTSSEARETAERT